MLDHGIKPVYVFDGKPPVLKSGELEKRRERRAEAQAELKEAEEKENQEDINKFTRRLVSVTKEHNAEVKQLLKLMGVPVVEAPGEAEASCAKMAQDGLVYATGTGFVVRFLFVLFLVAFICRLVCLHFLNSA